MCGVCVCECVCACACLSVEEICQTSCFETCAGVGRWSSCPLSWEGIPGVRGDARLLRMSPTAPSPRVGGSARAPFGGFTEACWHWGPPLGAHGLATYGNRVMILLQMFQMLVGIFKVLINNCPDARLKSRRSCCQVRGLICYISKCDVTWFRKTF